LTILVYVLAALFLLLAMGLFFAYSRTRHYGLLPMGFAYLAGGLLALLLVHWWPLAAGLALAWLLRWLGLEPGSERHDR
jgi:hypothetical protein